MEQEEKKNSQWLQKIKKKLYLFKDIIIPFPFCHSSAQNAFLSCF